MEMQSTVVPRAELHCHIEGAAPPPLVRKLAKRYNEDLGDLFNSAGEYDWHDFTSFMKAYDVAANLFRRPGDYAELAETYFRSIAEDGAIYGEVFISPDHAAAAGISYHAYVEGIAAGIERAKAETGIEGRMIAIGVRHFGAKAVEEAAKLVAANPHPLVTGFGLAGDERYGHPSNYAKAYQIAAEAGLGLTAHAGELVGPESVRDALDYLKITRVGHGVRAIEDEGLVQRLVEENITLEVCPGSNISLSVYEKLRFHPVNLLRQAGVKVTLSSDDPPFFHTTLAQEYSEVSRVFGWDRTVQKQITKNAIEAAFCDADTKERLLQKLEKATAG
ncbi:adenosine deaminase [Flexibacterium corallicola]|uniref:adenosine deaminase n=1 Tax=Flexibacterium corallicola TaxID=3037259 RepID=UPI00286F422B|nr:adenosine deaminase [Pseudovibrio sp. M1P-2-3]